MENFWKASLAVAGIGAAAFFTFLSLYRRWLQLDIFSQLTPQQTFIVMLVFLALTFLALIAGLVSWLAKGRREVAGDEALHRLEHAWSNVNYLDCNSLVGPDVANAANALQMTSIYWRNGYIPRSILLEKYGPPYCELFQQIDDCDKSVPGYTNPKKRCADFLTVQVRESYRQIRSALRKR